MLEQFSSVLAIVLDQNLAILDRFFLHFSWKSVNPGPFGNFHTTAVPSPTDNQIRGLLSLPNDSRSCARAAIPSRAPQRALCNFGCASRLSFTSAALFDGGVRHVPIA
jgi:hypothetical protein